MRTLVIVLAGLVVPTLAHAGGGFTVVTQESGVQALRDARPADWWVSGLHFIDLDDDDDLDLFLSSHDGSALAAINDGTGVFTEASGDYPSSEVHLPHDFDEDGLVDLSMTYVDGGAQWWRNTSAGGALGFEATEMTREGNMGRAQVIIDADADGDVDWLRGHFNGMSIDLGDGTGFFETDSEVLTIGAEWPSLLPADFDDDGDPDLVWITGGYEDPPGATRIFRNDGELVFTDVTGASGVPADDSVVMGVVDVDQDGDVDLVTHTALTFPHRVWLNDGAGTFSELAGAITGYDGGSEYSSWGLATVVDLDHDGIVDLVIDGKYYLKILRGTGGGHFEYANDAWGIQDIADSSVDGGFAFGDIDGDGDLDLIGYTETYPERYLAMYRNDVAAGNWVRVRAVGLPGRKAAPTAKIWVRPAGSDEVIGTTQLSIYCKQAQQTYYAFDESERHFGIGDAQTVDVSVHFYPSFKLVTVEDVPAGSIVRIGEDGRGGVVPPGGSDDSGGDESGSGGVDESGGVGESGGMDESGSAASTNAGEASGASSTADASESSGAGASEGGGEGCGCTSGRKHDVALALLFAIAACFRRRRHAFAAMSLALACGGDDDATGGETADTGATTASASTTNEPTDASSPTSVGETIADTSDGSSGDGPSDTSSSDDGPPPLPDSVDVELIPDAGVTGVQRVNFAVPLAAGQLADETLVVVTHEGAAIAAGTRGLAPRGDGSFRAMQIQIDLDVGAGTTITVGLGAAGELEPLALVPVEETLVMPDATAGPRVWAILPAEWTSGSGVVGPILPASQFEATPAGAWLSLCDYAANGTDVFLPQAGDSAPWLFDRVTALYRGYAITGDAGVLRSAYGEAGLYGMTATGEGADVMIPIPGVADDVKYHYTQGVAMHYLLTGDDRFRERAEDIGDRMATLWPSPGYDGGDDFWTERHAGFGLLAYMGAAMVSDDDAATYMQLADEAVTAYLELMATYPADWTDEDARCFAHTAEAHGEDFGFWGCSPWMSAIVADGLELYAIERGGTEGDAAREAIVKMGRIFATRRDPDGKPFYWMGFGDGEGEIDPDDEHWGESAYITAMAWHYSGEAELRIAADELVDGMAMFGSAPHVRSFNWQCRSAVAAPYYLAR
ncbi:MAG TPA: FG-GAP-like repeat-containing protein [Nannocystaceae bacterium]|nr:FG-GAP-like repeat-containing protein [Nannocystaceae bacterium]